MTFLAGGGVLKSGGCSTGSTLEDSQVAGEASPSSATDEMCGRGAASELCQRTKSPPAPGAADDVRRSEHSLARWQIAIDCTRDTKCELVTNAACHRPGPRRPHTTNRALPPPKSGLGRRRRQVLQQRMRGRQSPPETQ